MAVQAIRAQPVTSWANRLTNSLALQGYATVDLRSQPGPQMVSPQQLVAAARKGFEGLSGGWAQLPDHIQALRPLGVDTIAMRAQRRNLLMVLGRAEPTISLDSVREYFRGVELWFRATRDLLPKLKVNDQEKAGIAAISNLVGGMIGPQAAPIASKALTALIEASDGGSAITIHPVTKGAAFAQTWAAEDLTSLPSGGIGNRNWLWEVDVGRITYSDEPNDFGIGPPITAADLAAAIAATSG